MGLARDAVAAWAGTRRANTSQTPLMRLNVVGAWEHLYNARRSAMQSNAGGKSETREPEHAPSRREPEGDPVSGAGV